MLAFLRRLNRPLYAVLAATAIAGGLRFARLSYPDERVFDEFYYSKAACVFVGDSNKVCDVTSSDEKYWREHKWDMGSWVHPPLGKWMIALGEKTIGVTPFGWRVPSAIAGTAIVAMVAVIAQLLWGKPIWTFVAGLLMATENLSFVQSRVGLLDVFLAFWIVIGFLFLLLDRRWIERRTPPPPEYEDVEGVPAPPPPRVPSPVWRPWRFAAGAALGASFATKWSGATAIAGALIICVIWETTRRRKGGRAIGGAFGLALQWESFGLLLAFIVLPAVVYVVSYLPWFNHFGWSIGAWWENQKAMFDYHANLVGTALDPNTHTYTPTHPYFSPAWKWLPMVRPTAYWAHNSTGQTAEILAIGNVAIFWGSLLTLPYLAYAWRRRRDWAAGFILVAVLAQYVPWLKIGRPEFFFYTTPIAPFLVLAYVYAVRHLADARIVLSRPGGGTVESEAHPYRPIAWLMVVAAVFLFIWFYPVLTGLPISPSWYKAIVWFRSWV